MATTDLTDYARDKARQAAEEGDALARDPDGFPTDRRAWWRLKARHDAYRHLANDLGAVVNPRAYLDRRMSLLAWLDRWLERHPDGPGWPVPSAYDANVETRAALLDLFEHAKLGG